MRGILDSADCEVDGHDYDTMVPVLRSRLLLGQQVGDPIAEDKIDRRAKVFLRRHGARVSKSSVRPTWCWTRSMLLPRVNYHCISSYFFGP